MLSWRLCICSLRCVTLGSNLWPELTRKITFPGVQGPWQASAVDDILQEEYRNTPEAKRARASPEILEQSGQTSPDCYNYDARIWGSSAIPATPPDQGPISPDSPGSTMEITSRTADMAAFPQSGLDSPSAIPKPLGDITAGLQSFADLAADMATTDEIGWDQPVRLNPADNITAGVPALSTLLEEDEEGRTSAYGDENASVSMELTADTGAHSSSVRVCQWTTCLIDCSSICQAHWRIPCASS